MGLTRAVGLVPPDLGMLPQHLQLLDLHVRVRCSMRGGDVGQCWCAATRLFRELGLRGLCLRGLLLQPFLRGTDPPGLHLAGAL